MRSVTVSSFAPLCSSPFTGTRQRRNMLSAAESAGRSAAQSHTCPVHRRPDRHARASSRGVHVQRRPVLPIGQADPLQLRLMRAGKRIDDQSVAQQVGLHCGGNSGGVPLLRIGVRGRVRSGGGKPKLPRHRLSSPASSRARDALSARRANKSEKNSEEKSDQSAKRFTLTCCRMNRRDWTPSCALPDQNPARSEL